MENPGKCTKVGSMNVVEESPCRENKPIQNEAFNAMFTILSLQLKCEYFSMDNSLKIVEVILTIVLLIPLGGCEFHYQILHVSGSIILLQFRLTDIITVL